MGGRSLLRLISIFRRVASLEAAPSANIPLPSLEAFPLEPSAKAVPRPPTAPLGEASSQPPGSEVARLENGSPRPRHARPVGEPAASAAPQVVQPAVPAALVENRNFFQKLFGVAVAAQAGDLALYPGPRSRRRATPRSRRPLHQPPSRRRCVDAERPHGKRMVRLRRAPRGASGLRSADRRL